MGIKEERKVVDNTVAVLTSVLKITGYYKNNCLVIVQNVFLLSGVNKFDL